MAYANLDMACPILGHVCCHRMAAVIHLFELTYKGGIYATLTKPAAVETGCFTALSTEWGVAAVVAVQAATRFT